MKIMGLQTTDGVGLLAYAGLGVTSDGTQPSDWMSAVLRGRRGLTFEQSLGLLAHVATRELPKHLTLLRSPMHFIVVPAFVRGSPRLYSIDNVIDRKTGQHWYRYMSHQRTAEPGSPPGMRIGLAGSGGLHLHRQGRGWKRELLNLVNRHAEGKVSDLLIADHLAKLNCKARQGGRDRTVGPRSIVVWRRRPRGGGQQFYTGADRDRSSGSIPEIANGMDVRAIIGVFMGEFQRQLADQDHFSGGLKFEMDELNRLIADVPDEPDEKLR
jgi:hypothetical protein